MKICCPCGGIILADTEDWKVPLCYECAPIDLMDKVTRLEEIISYLQKVPTKPYEKELAEKLAIAIKTLTDIERLSEDSGYDAGEALEKINE